MKKNVYAGAYEYTHAQSSTTAAVRAVDVSRLLFGEPASCAHNITKRPGIVFPQPLRSWHFASRPLDQVLSVLGPLSLLYTLCSICFLERAQPCEAHLLYEYTWNTSPSFLCTACV